MKVIDKGTRQRRWLPLLALVALLLGMAARGGGILTGEFLRGLISDPYGTLIGKPLRLRDAHSQAIELPRLQVDMKFRHYEKILARREQALRDGILITEGADLVPADITLDGTKVSVRMRLKGDWADHFDTNKWSYRVRTRGGDTLLGMRRFSLHHPKTRLYLAEWAFLEHMRREGVLAPRYQFVRLGFNGEDRGIYAVEEHFAKELLESQGRREAPIAKLEEGPLWSQRVVARRAGLPWLGLDQLKFKSAEVGFFESGTLEENPLLREQANAARALLHGFQDGSLKASQVFDVTTMARYLALCQIWGADHALIFHNIRFYYDPLSTRLQPIAFDGEPRNWTLQDMQAARLMGRTTLVLGIEGFYTWLDEIYRDDVLRHAYLTELHRLSRPSAVETFEAEIDSALTGLLATLRTEWLDLESPLPALKRGAGFVWNKLNPEADLRAREVVPPAAGSSARIQVTNTAQVPVEILRVEGGLTSWVPDPSIEVAGREKIDAVVWQDILVPAQGETTGPWRLIYRSVGGSDVRVLEVVAQSPDLESPAVLSSPPSAEEAVARHSFLEMRGADIWILPGTWDVNEDLILPEGVAVRAEGAVTLRFASEALVRAAGPLIFHGQADAPIRLLPQNETWPGLAVLNAGSESSWKHVRVQATRGIHRPGWFLTGGITFYQSPVTMEGVRFDDHAGEDALNIVRSRFGLKECIFQGCASDAFDGDFVQGSVTACSFVDVGGDGVDVSGSIVDLRDVVALRVADKAISIGEDSQAKVYRLSVREGAIAIAAKDLSHVIVYGGQADQMKIGLTAYMKKSAYGPATIQAQEFALNEVEDPVLVQLESVVNWNGQHYAGSELDVRELYRLGVLGN